MKNAGDERVRIATMEKLLEGHGRQGYPGLG